MMVRSPSSASLAASALLALLLSTLPGPGASAQPSRTTKLYVGGSLGVTALFLSQDDLSVNDTGGGVHLRVGYGVSRVVTLYLGLNATQIDGDEPFFVQDAYEFAVGELGARLHLLPSRALMPYLDLGFNVAEASYEGFGLAFRGVGFTVGGGLAYYLSPRLALDLDVRLVRGQLSDVDVGDATIDVTAADVDYGAARVMVGVAWFPLR